MVISQRRSTLKAIAVHAITTGQLTKIVFMHVRIGIKDGRCVGIEDVPSGLACGCVCAACGCPLVARKGNVRAHHFSHAAGNDCPTTGETALHLAAKQVLRDRGELWLPEYTGSLREWCTESVEHSPIWDSLRDWATGTVFPARKVVADRVETEVNLGEIRPDVVFAYKQHELLIEVRVAHRVDEKKRRCMRAKGFACIEIDLSQIARDITLSDLADMVVGVGSKAAPRQWISCPKGEREAMRRSREVKRRFARGVQNARRRLEVRQPYYGIGSNVVCGCPINVYRGRHQARIIECMSCAHHVAYFGEGRDDQLLQSVLLGTEADELAVYCDCPDTNE